MQLPDVVNMPDGDISANFLDSFLRGNRDDQPRKQDGSILQALNLMNNAFVEARSHSTGSTTRLADRQEPQHGQYGPGQQRCT